jgi:hypothetical protein
MPETETIEILDDEFQPNPSQAAVNINGLAKPDPDTLAITPFVKIVTGKISDYGVPHKWREDIAKMIYHLAASGTPSRAIENAVGLSWPTIHKFYGEYYKAGVGEAERVVAGTIFDLAKNPENGAVALKAAQFWLACKAGWNSEGRASRDGQLPADQIPALDLSKLNDQQLEQLQSLLAAAEEGK